jgi:hypothetical protein
MFREDWLVEGLDTWLGCRLLAGQRRGGRGDGRGMFGATEPSMADVARRRAVDRRLDEAEKKVMGFEDVLAPGVDRHRAATWMDEAQKVVAEAWTEQALMRAERAGPTRGDLRTLVTGFSSLTSRLGQVPAAVRAEIYAPLGVRLTYEPASASVEAEVSPSHPRCWGKPVSEGRHGTSAHASTGVDGSTADMGPLPAPDGSRPPPSRVTLGR